MPGWVARRPDPTDGRPTLAVLTEAGRDQLQTAAPHHVEKVRELAFDPLPQAQLRQMNEINRRMRNAIEPGGTPLFVATGSDELLR